MARRKARAFARQGKAFSHSIYFNDENDNDVDDDVDDRRRQRIENDNDVDDRRRQRQAV